jgi:hypothetical protein
MGSQISSYLNRTIISITVDNENNSVLFFTGFQIDQSRSKGGNGSQKDQSRIRQERNSVAIKLGGIFAFGLTAKLSPKVWEDIFDPALPCPALPIPRLY